MTRKRDKRELASWLVPVLILVLAAAVRLSYLYSYMGSPDWNWLTVDNWYHHNWALRLADGDLAGGTTYFRAPFYVFCLGSLYALFGHGLLVGRIFGIVIGVISVGLTYNLGKQAFSRRIGIIAAFLHALYPICVYFEQELLLDPLFTLLFQAALLLLLKWANSLNRVTLFSTGLLFGLAAITRPTVLAIIPVAILFAILVIRNEERSMIAWLSVSLLLFAGFLVPVVPVFVRNLSVADDPVMISSQGGVNLYLGNNADADGISATFPEPYGHNWQISQITHVAETDAGHKLRPGEVSAYWTGKAVEWMTDSPAQFLMLYGKKVLYQLTNFEFSNNRNLPNHFGQFLLLGYNPLIFGVIFPLALVGLVRRWRDFPETKLIFFIILVYLLTTAFFFVNSRFRIPLIPLYLIMASVGLIEIFALVTKQSDKAVSTVLTVAIGLLVTFNPLLDSPKGSRAQFYNSKGLWYYSQGEWDKANAAFQQGIYIDPRFPELEMNLGLCWLKMGDADRAEEHLLKEQKNHPLRYKTYTNLASLALLKGQPEQALDWLKQASELAPYDLTSNRLAIRAAAQLDSEKHGLLDSQITHSVLQSDSCLQLLYEAGLAFSSVGIFDRAEQFLDAATRVPPPPVETDDGAFGPNFINSPENLKKARALAWYQLGYLSGRTGDYLQAIEQSTAAIELDSNLTAAYINLTSGYAALGEFDRADSVCRRAVILFPNDSTVQVYKQRLDQLPRF